MKRKTIKKKKSRDLPIGSARLYTDGRTSVVFTLNTMRARFRIKGVSHEHLRTLYVSPECAWQRGSSVVVNEGMATEERITVLAMESGSDDDDVDDAVETLDATTASARRLIVRRPLRFDHYPGESVAIAPTLAPTPSSEPTGGASACARRVVAARMDTGSPLPPPLPQRSVIAIDDTSPPRTPLDAADAARTSRAIAHRFASPANRSVTRVRDRASAARSPSVSPMAPPVPSKRQAAALRTEFRMAAASDASDAVAVKFEYTATPEPLDDEAICRTELAPRSPNQPRVAHASAASPTAAAAAAATEGTRSLSSATATPRLLKEMQLEVDELNGELECIDIDAMASAAAASEPSVTEAQVRALTDELEALKVALAAQVAENEEEKAVLVRQNKVLESQRERALAKSAAIIAAAADTTSALALQSEAMQTQAAEEKVALALQSEAMQAHALEEHAALETRRCQLVAEDRVRIDAAAEQQALLALESGALLAQRARAAVEDEERRVAIAQSKAVIDAERQRIRVDDRKAASGIARLEDERARFAAEEKRRRGVLVEEEEAARAMRLKEQAMIADRERLALEVEEKAHMLREHEAIAEVHRLERDLAAAASETEALRQECERLKLQEVERSRLALEDRRRLVKESEIRSRALAASTAQAERVEEIARITSAREMKREEAKMQYEGEYQHRLVASLEDSLDGIVRRRSSLVDGMRMLLADLDADIHRFAATTMVTMATGGGGQSAPGGRERSETPSARSPVSSQQSTSSRSSPTYSPTPSRQSRVLN